MYCPRPLDFARGLDVLQVLAETVTRLALPPRQIFAEPRLCAVAAAFLHALELTRFGLAIGNGCSYDIFKPIFRQEEHPIGVAHDKIAGRDGMRTDGRTAQDIRRPDVQTLRACRQRPHAEHRKADLAELRTVAMQSPDNKARHSRSLGLEHNDVADARLVYTCAIIDNDDIASRGPLKSFEKNIDAAHMTNWPGTTGAPHVAIERTHACRRETDRNARSQAAIRQIRRRKFVKLINQSLAQDYNLHASFERAGPRFPRNQPLDCPDPSNGQLFRISYSYEITVLEFKRMKPNFDMDALRTMVLGLELGSFARAASQLGRSQSAVSMQLKKLEEQAGQILFRRNGRGLVPTEAGDSLLMYARRIIALNDEAAASVGSTAAAASVRMGLPQEFFEDVMPDALGLFSQRRPAIHVEVRAGRNYSLEEEINSGRLDVALAFFKPNSSNHGTLIASLPMMWFGRKGMSRSEVQDPIPLVVFDHPCLFRQAAFQVLEGSKLRWRLSLTTPSLPGVWAALQSGYGISPRTSHRVPPGIRDVGAEFGFPPLPAIELRMLTASELSPAASDLRDVLQQVVRKRVGENIVGPRKVLKPSRELRARSQ